MPNCAPCHGRADNVPGNCLHSLDCQCISFAGGVKPTEEEQVIVNVLLLGLRWEPSMSAMIRGLAAGLTEYFSGRSLAAYIGEETEEEKDEKETHNQ